MSYKRLTNRKGISKKKVIYAKGWLKSPQNNKFYTLIYQDFGNLFRSDLFANGSEKMRVLMSNI